MKEERGWKLVPPEEVDLTPFHRKPDAPYRIGEGDTLEIVVLGYPEISRPQALVRPDGRITIPMLGDIEVAGLEPTEASRVVTEGLAPFLKRPTATVLVSQAQASRAMVLGMVRAPGSYVMRGPTRLRDLLAMAGGLVYRDREGSDPVAADLGRGALFRGEELVPVDFARLLVAGDRTQDVYVHPGDIVVLPPAREREVLVLGEVRGPRALSYRGGMTLLSALAQAGGFTPDARQGQVRVIRGSLAKPRVYLLDVVEILAAQRTDVALRPGDVVYVSPTPLAEWNRVLQQLLPSLQTLLTTRYLIEGTPRPLYDWGQ